MGKIKLLSDEIVNQIAAGEIVERPSSALKEIVENSIDSGANNIEIFLKNGGKAKIVVNDNGSGLSRDDLSMSIQRHATSKLNGSNLFEINSYGFRGEALPSIASISKFSIESNGFGINVDFSEVSEIFPSSVSNGTRVCVENIFDSIPARLKFLKSDNVELSNCISTIENFSLIRKDVSFNIRAEDRVVLSFKNDTIEDRISKILGRELFKKSVYFEESDGIISIKGYLFHPMDSRYSQAFQRIFVNGRIVKDRNVSASIKNAYKDLILTGRFAACVIFIEIDPFYIDVNVSPTKSEIRFRDSSYVQKMLTDSIKKNLIKFDRVTINFDISKFSKDLDFEINDFTDIQPSKIENFIPSLLEKNLNFSENNSVLFKNVFQKIQEKNENDITHIQKIINEPETENFFGEPVCQIFDTYIISKTKNEIIIIDQHAVHEKITMEKIIENINLENKQYLLRPEILDFTDSQINVAKIVEDELKNCGFNIEIVQNSIIVSAIPTVMNDITAIQFIKDVLEFNELIEELKPIDFIKRKIADKACHNSIRSGRKLLYDEMVAIINDMEKTKSIHQCNHHRPSFIVLSKEQLEAMFDRR